MTLQLFTKYSIDNKITLKPVNFQDYLMLMLSFKNMSQKLSFFTVVYVFIYQQVATFFHFSFTFFKLVILKRNFLRYEYTEKEFN